MALPLPRDAAEPISSPGLPGIDAPRAKSLRPSDRRRGIDARTERALSAFEVVAASFEPTPEAITALRRAASVAMRELCRENTDGTLPADLSAAVERWLEGEFNGTSVDIEIANHALVHLLGSEVLVDDYRDEA